MSFEIPFGVKSLSDEPVERKYFNNANTPYTNTAQVISQITAGLRYRGLVVNVNGVEYHFKDGIGDGDLIIKASSNISSINDLSDVTITSPAIHHIVMHDGTDFKNVDGRSVFVPLFGTEASFPIVGDIYIGDSASIKEENNTSSINFDPSGNLNLNADAGISVGATTTTLSASGTIGMYRGFNSLIMAGSSFVSLSIGGDSGSTDKITSTENGFLKYRTIRELFERVYGVASNGQYFGKTGGDYGWFTPTGGGTPVETDISIKSSFFTYSL